MASEELCGNRIPGSTISTWHKELDNELAEFLERRLEGDYPYVVLPWKIFHTHGMFDCACYMQYNMVSFMPESEINSGKYAVSRYYRNDQKSRFLLSGKCLV